MFYFVSFWRKIFFFLKGLLIWIFLSVSFMTKFFFIIIIFGLQTKKIFILVFFFCCLCCLFLLVPFVIPEFTTIRMEQKSDSLLMEPILISLSLECVVVTFIVTLHYTWTRVCVLGAYPSVDVPKLKF